MVKRTQSEPSAPCPKCQSDSAPTFPKFTWWGGVLGPKLLHHAVCRQCGTGFNAKTGNSNTGPIVLYTVVLAVIFGAILIALRA